MPSQAGIRGNVGTNQYRTRPRVVPANPTAPLVAQAQPAALPSRRCGEMWGGPCTQLVSPPLFSCGEHPSLKQRESVADIPGTPPTMVGLLSRDHAVKIRRLVARRAYLDPGIVSRLAQDRDVIVRRDCPPDTLARASRDDSPEVRQLVAQHPDCPPDTLARLAQDRLYIIQYHALRHQNCPSAALSAASGHRDSQIRRLAAAHPHCPAEILSTLVRDEQDNVAIAAAANPCCPPDSLERASHHSNVDVQWMVAGNPACPVPTLERLLQGPPELAFTAAYNPSLPEYLRAMWQLAT